VYLFKPFTNIINKTNFHSVVFSLWHIHFKNNMDVLMSLILQENIFTFREKEAIQVTLASMSFLVTSKFYGI